MSERLDWCLDQLSFDEYDFLHKLPGEVRSQRRGLRLRHRLSRHPRRRRTAALTPDSSDEEAADALLDREGRLGIGGHIHVQMDRTCAAGA